MRGYREAMGAQRRNTYEIRKGSQEVTVLEVTLKFAQETRGQDMIKKHRHEPQEAQ